MFVNFRRDLKFDIFTLSTNIPKIEIELNTELHQIVIKFRLEILSIP
jgi:hypothetical protein